MVEYDSEKQDVRHIPVIQDDNMPLVQELQGIKVRFILLWIDILSSIYQLPHPLYALLEKLNAFLFYKIWNFQITLFHIRERGLSYCTKKAYGVIKRKLSKGLRI